MRLPVPTSRENRKTEAQGTCGPQMNGRTPSDHDRPGRLNEMAAGGMGSLLMAQPILWPGVVAEFRHTSPDAFQKFASLPTRTARAGTKALRSFLLLLPMSMAFLAARPGDWENLSRPTLEATRLFTTAASAISGVSGAQTAMGGLLGIVVLTTTGAGQ